jgi:hypothetical protein
MNDLQIRLISLRYVVALLGERSHFGWWPCSFLDEAGLETLDYNFPRAPLMAGFTATCLAAKRLHDDRIGRTGVTHLFRQDPDLEILLQRSVAEGRGSVLCSLPADRDGLMAELARLGEEEIDAHEGPVQVGLLNDAATPRGISGMARHYHAGFRLGLRVFPYFAAPRS